MPGSRPISADFDDVRAGRDVHLGDTHNYYSATNRPPGLHVNVPAMPAHFVGREELVADVARRLVAGSTLALSADGLPGVGKTTLAVALAYRREVLDHFTDGVLWGALGLQPNVMEVLASWASALGIDVSEATDPAKRAALVHNAIAQRRFLLVIDDAWAPADNALLLKCGGPNSVHFLTTRDESIARAFAGADGKVEIRELEPDDALELLRKLAPEACAADLDAARELVRAVGYLPLAIELMGAYLSAAENRYFREQQTAALQRMADPAERLRQACRRLGDSHGAQVTLKEAIRLSLEGLPVEAVDAFHALGAFAPKPESFDSAAATEISRASLPVLSRLIERHLIDKNQDVLSLHQVIADVAREGTDEIAVLRHAEHYLQRALLAKNDWQAIEAIYGQIKWAYNQLDDAPSILSFAAAVGDYQSMRGLREDALLWSARELDAAREMNDSGLEAVALTNRGWLHYQLGEFDVAIKLYEMALTLQRTTGDQVGEAVSLNAMGVIHKSLGEHERALEYYRQALSLRTQIGDQESIAATLNNLGALYNSLGRYDEALEKYQQVLPIVRALGHQYGEAVTLNNIGIIHKGAGEERRALEYYEQGLLLLRAVGNRHGEAAALNNVGSVYLGLGETERALGCFNEALSVRRTIGDRYGEAATLNNLGSLYVSLGQLDRSIECYNHALQLVCDLRARDGEAVTRYNLAMLHKMMGNLKEAVDELRVVVELDEILKRPQFERDRTALADVENQLADQSNAGSISTNPGDV